MVFSLRAYLDYANDDSPVGMRQKFQAFFIANGFIYEGFKVAEEIKSQFNGDKIFTKTLGEFLNLQQVIEFKDKLKTIRDKTFHFDQDLIVQPLKYKIFQERTLLSGNSSQIGDSYFNIVTALEFHYMTGELQTEEEFKADLSEMLRNSADMVELFSNYINKFITATAKKLKISVEVTSIKTKMAGHTQ